MAGISLSGVLPGGDQDGLSAIMSDLIRDPKRMHFALAIIDTRKIITDADSGEVRPVVRVRRIEIVADADDQQVARRLMTRALDRRTGRESLPFDLEAELDQVFGERTEDDFRDKPGE